MYICGDSAIGTKSKNGKVVKNMVDPMENKRLKQQVKRLNRLLEAARDERDYYKDKCKGKKV